jgi:hypothetical protein
MRPLRGKGHQSVWPRPSAAFSPVEVTQTLLGCKTRETSARLRVR